MNEKLKQVSIYVLRMTPVTLDPEVFNVGLHERDSWTEIDT